MDISDEFKKVGIPLAQETFESPLEYMADSFMPYIEIHCVTCMEGLHDFGERVLSSFHEQVDVVGHQGICMKAKIEAVLASFEEMKIFFTIPLI